jgi:hypothetical protein
MLRLLIPINPILWKFLDPYIVRNPEKNDLSRGAFIQNLIFVKNRPILDWLYLIQTFIASVLC